VPMQLSNHVVDAQPVKRHKGYALTRYYIWNVASAQE